MKKKIQITIVMALTVMTFTGCSNISNIISQESGNSNQQNITQKNDVVDEDFILPSANREINEIDLSKLNETELRYAYAEIFARHGKEFDNENWIKYFSSKKWYIPNPSYNDSQLTNLEKENANFIKEYIHTNYETTTQPTTQSVVYIPQPVAPPITNSGDNRYIIADSSVRQLTRSELSQYNSATLALIRNEIYARNGYVFQKEYYRNYFGAKSWYAPNPNFNESWLSATEKYNVQLIKSME